MLRVDCYNFYKLATVIHPLTELSGGGPLSEVWIKLYWAREELDSFFKMFPLKTSLPPAQTLYREIVAIVPLNVGDLRLTDDGGDRRKLELWQEISIKNAAVEFESVLKAELIGWDTYFVSQKAAFSTTELIQQAELMVPEAGRAALSQMAVADFRQAGMCLAFNLPTAASFHVIRATEAVIKQYYMKLFGVLPTVKMRNWGAYHKKFSQCGNADSKVLGWLKHLTEEYRNPVLHPDEMLSADDALEFINACIALVTSMARAMVKLDPAKEPTTTDPSGSLRPSD